MTDTQIIKTIHEILTQLHDPKTGFNGYRHELGAQIFTPAEYIQGYTPRPAQNTYE